MKNYLFGASGLMLAAGFIAFWGDFVIPQGAMDPRPWMVAVGMVSFFWGFVSSFTEIKLQK